MCLRTRLKLEGRSASGTRDCPDGPQMQDGIGMGGCSSGLAARPGTRGARSLAGCVTTRDFRWQGRKHGLRNAQADVLVHRNPTFRCGDRGSRYFLADVDNPTVWPFQVPGADLTCGRTGLFGSGLVGEGCIIHDLQVVSRLLLLSSTKIPGLSDFTPLLRRAAFLHVLTSPCRFLPLALECLSHNL